MRRSAGTAAPLLQPRPWTACARSAASPVGSQFERLVRASRRLRLQVQIGRGADARAVPFGRWCGGHRRYCRRHLRFVVVVRLLGLSVARPVFVVLLASGRLNLPDKEKGKNIFFKNRASMTPMRRVFNDSAGEINYEKVYEYSLTRVAIGS